MFVCMCHVFYWRGSSCVQTQRTHLCSWSSRVDKELPPWSCEKLQPPKSQSALCLKEGKVLKWHRVILHLLVVNLCFFSALHTLIFLLHVSNLIQLTYWVNFGPMDLMISACEITPVLTMHVFVCVCVRVSKCNNKCFLFDSNTMCKVINLITRAADTVTVLLAGSTLD